MRGTEDRIMDAAMQLVIEKGYSDMTTLDIASLAGVSEVTLFRRFGTKKDIILAALKTDRWVPTLDSGFQDDAVFELQPDFVRFLTEYCSRVTPQFVRISIGLRSPQLFEETAPIIMRVPVSYMDAMMKYITEMQKRGKCKEGDPHALAMSLFSSALGFVFLQASFGKQLTSSEEETFIITTAAVWAAGLEPTPDADTFHADE